MPSASACFQSASVAMWKIRTRSSCRTDWHSGAMSDLHCPARFIVARHGEAEYESDAMTESGGSLTALGRDQARGWGSGSAGEQVAGIVCSDLARAVQTAEIAAGVLGLPVKVREGLQEFPAGDFRGRPTTTPSSATMAHAWLAGDLALGVPGGETGRQAADRVLAVLDEVADQFRGETVLVVSHGGVILALWGAIAPGSPAAPEPDRSPTARPTSWSATPTAGGSAGVTTVDDDAEAAVRAGALDGPAGELAGGGRLLPAEPRGLPPPVVVGLLLPRDRVVGARRRRPRRPRADELPRRAAGQRVRPAHALSRPEREPRPAGRPVVVHATADLRSRRTSAGRGWQPTRAPPSSAGSQRGSTGCGGTVGRPRG